MPGANGGRRERASRGGLRDEELSLPLGRQRVDDLVEAFAFHDPVERIGSG